MKTNLVHYRLCDVLLTKHKVVRHHTTSGQYNTCEINVVFVTVCLITRSLSIKHKNNSTDCVPLSKPPLLPSLRRRED